MRPRCCVSRRIPAWHALESDEPPTGRLADKVRVNGCGPTLWTAPRRDLNTNEAARLRWESSRRRHAVTSGARRADFPGRATDVVELHPMGDIFSGFGCDSSFNRRVPELQGLRRERHINDRVHRSQVSANDGVPAIDQEPGQHLLRHWIAELADADDSAQHLVSEAPQTTGRPELVVETRGPKC